MTKNTDLRSFLNFLGKGFNIKNIPKISDEAWGQSLVLTGNEEESPRCFCFIINTPWRIDMFLSSLSAQVRPDDHVFIALQPGDIKKFPWYLLVRHRIHNKIQKMRFNFTGIYGIAPSPWDTQIIFDLKKHILKYVELVSFRHNDSTFKYIFKKILIYSMGVNSWNGWKLVALENDDETSFIREMSNHFMFLTQNRNVSLIFEDGKDIPTLVVKKGPTDSVQCEWESHKWARDILDDSVPAIHDFSTSGKEACLKIEYIPEKKLNNIAAKAMLRKGKLDKEIIALLDFFLYTFERFVGDQVINQSLPETVIAVTQKGLTYLFESETEDSLYQELNDSLSIKKFPLIPQHGDFSVRNILYRKPDSRVIIDWEDFGHNLLPLVDYNMLLVSLKDIWSKFTGKKADSLTADSGALARKLKQITDAIQETLNLNNKEWRMCNHLSLAYLVGMNKRKGREATAGRIRDEFHRQLTNGMPL